MVQEVKEKKRYGKIFDECKLIFQIIDDEVKRLGRWKDKPTRAETLPVGDNFLVVLAKDIWRISIPKKKTPEGRRDQDA